MVRRGPRHTYGAVPAFRGADDRVPAPETDDPVLQPAGSRAAVSAYVCAGGAVLLGVLGGVVLPLLAGPLA